ncbi:tRNA nuclease CdiA-2 [Burkholderia diffusa]|uniref:hemagglutinin repeat-containing protein n=1 Tax=Burkholderia diffusa TaxID=488732 RepID=UPI001CB52B11|nr:hemagglutinin repeat-containing protein [Burkholderia diffusa]CAG9241132.1 tRNA nuclease CdiA-2 [Burkholderia diffusa]
MNKNQYRLVFSRVRGMLVAVEETANSAGKATQGETVCVSVGGLPQLVMRFALRHTALAVLLVAGVVPTWAMAQIVPGGANAPSVIQTPNGLPQVNINRPVGGGAVSMNTYNQFDVSRAGAILNNSPVIVNTTQAGVIGGNPNFLPGQSARLIVNQVNSNNPSLIQGYVEIAGAKANLILANPSGLILDGGGFLNTSRATLTTGTPLIDANGNVTGINVTQGNITVQGAGFNASNLDQVDLLARAVKINAATYGGNALNVVAGANHVDYGTLAATPIAGVGAVPAIGIDVSQLGGMYAGKILLASNEYGVGVGVSNAGVVAAQAGDLNLQSNGRLVLSGRTEASGNIAMASANGVTNSGTTYAQQSVSVNTGADVLNTGTLAAQQNTSVNAGSVTSTGTLGAGVDSDGSVGQSGDLTVLTNGQLNATGQNIAGGNATFAGSGVNLAGSTTAANAGLSMSASAGDVNLTSATTSAHGAISAQASGAVINDHAAMSGGSSVTLAGSTVSNQAGQVSSTGPLVVLASGQLLNQSGVLVSQNTAAIRGGAIVNTQGSMQSAAGMSVSGASMQNDAGRVVALGTDGLSVTTTGQILNTAGTTATGAQGGVMGSNGATVVQGGSVVNHGAMSGATNLTVSGQNVDDSNGTMASAQTTTVNAGSQFVNANGAVTGQTAVVDATTINNDSGNIQSVQVGLNGTNLQNHAGVVTQTGTGPMAVNITGTLDNSAGGTIQTNSTDLTLAPVTLIDDNGTITHAGTGTLTLGNGTGSISNVAGHIASNGQVVAQTGTMNNTAGSVTGQTGLTATVGGALTNDAGQLGSGTSATIHSGSLSNHNGQIVSPTLTATVDGTLDNSSGSIQTNQATIAATDLLNRGGNLTQFGTGPMTVNVVNLLDNSQGGVIQTNSTNLLLTPATLMNDAGKLTFGGTGTLTIAPSHGTGAFSNVGGSVVSNGQAVVQAGTWNNNSGTFAARQGIVANVTGDISNQQGLIRSQAALSLIAGGSLLNQNGVVASGTSASSDTSTLAIQAAAIQNAAGQILNFGTGNMTVQGGSQLVNTAGMVSGNGNLAVNASAISNTNGAQMSGASLQVQGDTIDNSAGKMGSSSGDTSITTTGAITDTNGQIGSAHDLTVTAPTLLGGGTYSAANNAQFNLQGDFSLSPDYSFNAGNQLGFSLPGTFTNTGYLSALYNLNVSAGDILNSGTMMAGNLLSTHSNTVSNTGTMVGGSVSLAANTSITNVGPTALIGASDSNGTLELLAPVIQNRDDTTATDTTPQTSIVGLGKVVLAGGKDANGNYTNAQSILNQSALIQSGSDMTLDANQVTNTRRVMTTTGTTNNVDPAVLQALGISLSGCASYFAVNCANGGQMIAGLRSDNITPAETAALIKQPGGMYIEPPHGGQWNSAYYYTTYTGVATANLIQSISPAGQIMSGGNLDASATGTLKNYWSNIAAVGNIKNPKSYDANSWGASGQQAPSLTVTYSGQYHYNNYDSSEYNWQLPFGNAPFVTSNPGGYTPAPADVHTYALPTYESTLVSGGTLSGNGVNINNTAGNAGLPSLGLVAGQVPSLTPGSVTGQLSGTGQRATVPGGGPVMVDPIIAKATALNVLNNLTIPQGGLFKPDTAPGATYLIETNPAFTNQRTFMSSDYYLQQLGMNPQTVEKRLGDGFYEQQLVRNQITALTGKAVLGPYTDTQAMYEAMMASGAALAKSLDLPLGMSLTADEVASLTSNVVMMETRVVDGQSVLVPVVYLAKANQQNWNGPLIAATDIDLENAQTFKNSGTITASDAMTIHGQSIDSAFGALTSGGAMDLKTAGDMDFTSATVKAGSLNLDAGGNLLLNTATNTLNQVSPTGATRTTVTLGPLAQINVTGDAAIKTGGNFEQNAGALTVGGNFGMLIGGNWDLGAVQTGEHKVVERANGVSNTDINSATSSSVTVGGVSMVGVMGDLTAHGAQMDFGQGGTIAVKGNTTLDTASATSTIDSNSSGSDHHGSYSETLHSSDQTQTGTSVHSGDSLNMLSGGDINVIGSSVTLDKGNLNLYALGNVTVGAATETHVSNMDESHDHSGVASHTSATNRVDQTTTYADGSALSADGVTITSGKDINVIGSSIVGTHDVGLSAKDNVNIVAATNTYQDNEYHQEKHSGLSGSGGLGFTIGSSEQSDRYNASSVTQSQSRSTVGSVEGNVTVNAGQNVHIGGSDIVAGKAAGDVSGATGNIAITGQNVTIDPGLDQAQSHDQQEAHSSGLTVAVTGTPFDTVRNLKADASSGNGFQRGQSVLTEIGASAADVPSISVTYGQSRSSSTTDMSSMLNSGSTVRGAGNVTVKATGGAQKDANGNPIDGDISVIGSAISAGGTATLDANRNVNLLASTDQTQQSTATSSSSSSLAILSTPSLGDVARWVGGTANSGGNSPSPYNASRSNTDASQNATQQTPSSVIGNAVIVKSKTGDINVVGSGISGTQGVDLIAQQGAINVLAGLDTNTTHQESSSHQVGSLGSNGTATGFTVGVSNSHTVQDTASQTQSTMRSQIVSGNGNVTLDAKQDITVAGSDLSAAKDLTLIGKNLNLDPGTDATQSRMSQDSSQFGVSLALGGAVGNAVAQLNRTFAQPARGGDSRLQALDAAQTGLAAYSVYQAASNLGNPNSQALVKATVSIGGGTSHAESQSSSLSTDGSTLSAGRTATLIATGSGATDANGNAADGDINASGTRITAQNVDLNAARDINLTSAKDTSQQTSSNDSSNGSIGVGAALGGSQNGFTLELGASVANGHMNGQSVTNHDTQITATDTLSMTSGRDANLRGAEVSGNTVVANVGRDLNIASQQDTATYNSTQSSAGFQASICVPPFCYGQTVSGSASASEQDIKASFQSVNQQSGIYAGTGGYNVNVGNHTQLDGGVIASMASADQNSLSTQTLGFTNLDNHASYSGDTVGVSVSGGFGTSTPGGVNLNTPVKPAAGSSSVQNSQGFGPSGFSAAGTSSDASGTTYAAISPGTITVRGDTAGHDSTAGLSRDTATANGAVQNTFNAQTVQNDMAIQQSVGQVGMQVVGDVANALADKALANETKARLALAKATAAGDTVGEAQANADITAAQQQEALWANDGAARIASHAGVAALGAAMGGGNVAGAVGGTIAGDVAGNAASGALGDTLGSTLLSNVASGLAGAAVGGALGGSAGAMSGANGALSADLFNRQLHPQERALISSVAKGMAAKLGQTTADQTTLTSYWTDMLTLAAAAQVDANAQNQLTSYEAQLANAANASGNPQVYSKFMQDLGIAQDAIARMSGTTIWGTTGPIVADGSTVKTFQSTTAQYNDSNLFNTPAGTAQALAPGQTPHTAGMTQQSYATAGAINQQVSVLKDQLLANAAAPKEGVTPVYPVETAIVADMTGGLVGGLAKEATGVVLGGTKALQAASETAGNGNGLFAGAEIGPYTPTSSVAGQAFDFSCAAASCKMAANLADVPETYIRQAIQTDTTGTALKNIPEGLQQLGFTGTSSYIPDATAASIASATESGAAAVVNVSTPSGGIHAIVVDSIKNGVAYIRDPWPIGTGSAYSVSVDALQEAMTGKAVIIHP